jgi:hypothetical protein
MDGADSVSNPEPLAGTEALFLQPFDPLKLNESCWTIDHGLCPQCQSMIADALSGWESRRTNWTEYQEYPDIQDICLILSEDPARTVGSALEFLHSRCQLCAIIARELSHLPEQSRYTIYVRPQTRGSLFISLIDRYKGIPITSRHNTLACIGLFQGTWPPVHSRLNTDSLDDIRYLWPITATHNFALDNLRIIPSVNLKSSEDFNLAQNLSSKCDQEHELCLTARSQHGLPKRVLDISPLDDRVFLYISKSEALHYATLSYCWGPSLPLKTLTANIVDHCKGIPLDAFTQTLRDGIRVAKAFGFKYLWIDALCIIQDDPLDWAEQAAAMTDIYHKCSLNISAEHSRDCNDGLIRRIRDYGCTVASLTSQATQLVAVTAPVSWHEDHLSESPLSKRGWVFQEALVSPASLRYTICGIEWECSQGLFDRNGNSIHISPMIHPISRQPLKRIWANFLVTCRRLHLQVASDDAYPHRSSQDAATRLAYMWNDFVSTFSQKRLTMKRDKLPAVAGIASSFARELNWNYAAGLWEEHLKIGLTWCRDEEASLVRQQDRAPSWSWASVDGLITYHRVFSVNNARSSRCNLHPELDLEIVKVDIKEVNPGGFGEVLSGKIEAVGCIHEVTIDKESISGSLPFAQGNYFDITFDEETDLKEPRQVWVVRIVKHEEWKYRRAGCRNFFLILNQTGLHENEFKRVGIAICDYSEEKFDSWEYRKSKVQYQADLDASISIQRSRFTLV